MKTTTTIVDILRQINEGETYFLKTDTMEIVNPKDIFKKYLPENPTIEDYQNLPSKRSLNIYPLPNYEYINHKEIMTFYVKEIVQDKQIRKELFDTLRNYDYLDKFYDVLKNHNLYDDYDLTTYDYYTSVFNEWCEQKNIEIHMEEKRISKC